MKKKAPFVKYKKLYLAGKKKQKGDFILGTALGVVIPLIAKLLGGKRRKKKKMVRRRNNIVLVKRDTPKKVTLPNGRTFLAKYRRVTRQYLPDGITIARTYRGQPVQGRRPVARAPARSKPGAAARASAMLNLAHAGKARGRARGAAWRRNLRGQIGRGLGDVMKAVASSPFAQEIGKNIITKSVNAITSIFKRGTKKIKNKHLRKMAKSEIVPDIVDEGTRRLYGGIGL